MFCLLPWDGPTGSSLIKFLPVTMGLLTSRVVSTSSLFLLNYSVSGIMLLKRKTDRVWGMCCGGGVEEGRDGERERERETLKEIIKC